MGVINTGNVTGINLQPHTSHITNSNNRGQDNTFASYLNNALDEVSGLHQQASDSALQVALGNNEYLHNTTIAYEKAILALQLTVEMRNKLVSAYEEIMRMQI